MERLVDIQFEGWMELVAKYTPAEALCEEISSVLNGMLAGKEPSERLCMLESTTDEEIRATAPGEILALLGPLIEEEEEEALDRGF